LDYKQRVLAIDPTDAFGCFHIRPSLKDWSFPLLRESDSRRQSRLLTLLDHDGLLRTLRLGGVLLCVHDKSSELSVTVERLQTIIVLNCKPTGYGKSVINRLPQ
jgi:hypothetical protein